MILGGILPVAQNYRQPLKKNLNTWKLFSIVVEKIISELDSNQEKEILTIYRISKQMQEIHGKIQNNSK